MLLRFCSTTLQTPNVYHFPNRDFGKNVLAVEFSTKLPWMISELP
jgi:hypothetical protein